MYFLFPIFQMRKLRLREFEDLAKVRQQGKSFYSILFLLSYCHPTSQDLFDAALHGPNSRKRNAWNQGGKRKDRF